MEIPLLKDLVIILSLAIVVIYLFHLIKIPSIVGFLLTGILLGPHGFGLISDPHEVETLSEIGVILLLFTIGLEFSFRSLLQIKRMALLGGFLQVGLTILLTFIISIAFGQSLEKSLFYGFFVSLSSTAIVMKLIQDKGETDSLHGRNSLGILIFQDLAIIPLMLLVPLLSDQKTEAGGSLLAIAGGLGIVVVVLAGSFWLIPKLLYYIAKTRIRELFLLSVFIICFAIAFLTSSVGLSLALGAFVAGLMISESEYSHQAISHILPFKDIFTSLFFVSIGMLLNTKFMIEYPILILLLTLGVLSLKGFVVALVNVLLGYPIRVALLVAFGLSQVGEFSFLLAKVGMTHKLIDGWIYQIVLAVTVVTMMLTPVLMWLSPYVTNALKAIPCSRWLINRFERGRLEADSS
ncbi:MAG: cation:proton antiporter, partial [Spirochaetota bacterium]|nr:cation:proton antiporter [Spirochaetota bacterium]